MGKGKKKGTKDSGISEGFFNTAVESLRQYRRVTKEIGKMSTGQKVVGGLLLLAAGYAYLNSQDNDTSTKAKPSLAAPTEADEAATEPVGSRDFGRRRKKAHSHDV